MSKIIVFWIEDNPKSSVSTINRKFLESQYFDFLIFQNIVEVKEYLEMFKAIRNCGLDKKISFRLPSAIPDIVIFDYLLSDSLNKVDPGYMFHYAIKEEYELIKKHSIASRLKSEFDKLFEGKTLFIERNDVKEDNWDSTNLKEVLGIQGSVSPNDEYGLYCGLALLREFIDYPICGVPATSNKKDRNRLNQGGKFFEWLNEYDLKDSLDFIRQEVNYIEEKNIENVVLPFAVGLLRNRILSKISENKIIVDLKNTISLMDIYSNAEELENIVAKTFRFKSAYGWRELPIAGLFFDCNDEPGYQSIEKNRVSDNLKTQIDGMTIRLNNKEDNLSGMRNAAGKSKLNKEIEEIKNDISILETRKRIFDSLSQKQFEIWLFLSKVHEKMLTTCEEIKEVIKISDKLWNSFKNDVEPRLELAYLTRVQTDAEDGNYRQKRLAELFERFDINKTHNKISDSSEVSIVNEMTDNNTTSIRLVIGHLITRAIICLKKAETAKSANLVELSNFEIYCLLFPVANDDSDSVDSPLYHPLDYGAKSLADKYIKSALAKKINAPGNNDFFSLNWLTPSEKRITKSLFICESVKLPKFLNE